MKTSGLLIFFLFGMVFQHGMIQAQWDTFSREGITARLESASREWLENLYEMGVYIEDQTTRLTDEARQVATDSVLRKTIYRETYRLDEAHYLFAQYQYKIAFWHLINLYTREPESREKILQYIITLDQALQMDKVLISVFYTYAFFDPEIGSFSGDKPDIRHPEILDEKLARVREMVNAVINYRSVRKDH